MKSASRKTIEAGLILHRLHLIRGAPDACSCSSRSRSSTSGSSSSCAASISSSASSTRSAAPPSRLTTPKPIPFSTASSSSPAPGCSWTIPPARSRPSRPAGIFSWWMKRITLPGRRKPRARNTRWWKRSRGKRRAFFSSPPPLQQLGPEGHFARLAPSRSRSLLQTISRGFSKKQKAMRRWPKPSIGSATGSPFQKPTARSSGRDPARICRHFDALVEGDETARPRLVAELLDEFGTGRVMFRNTRAALSGFPRTQGASRSARKLGKGEENGNRAQGAFGSWGC